MSLLALAQLGRGVVPPDEPVLRADDEGVLRGRAVFETLRVYDGRPFELHPHFDRLTESARKLRLPAPPLAALQSLAHDALAAAGEPDCVLRFLWTPATGLALVSPLPPGLEELRARGLRLQVCEWAPTGALAGAKSTSYAENMAAQAAAEAAGLDDALFVAPDGLVLEAPTANVWFREGDLLLTPSLDLPILAGVTRAVVCRLAPRVEEGRYDLERLLRADEVFLTSSVREVMPVAQVADRSFGPGPAAAELQNALRRYAASV